MKYTITKSRKHIWVMMAIGLLALFTACFFMQPKTAQAKVKTHHVTYKMGVGDQVVPDQFFPGTPIATTCTSSNQKIVRTRNYDDGLAWSIIAKKQGKCRVTVKVPSDLFIINIKVGPKGSVYPGNCIYSGNLNKYNKVKIDSKYVTLYGNFTKMNRNWDTLGKLVDGKKIIKLSGNVKYRQYWGESTKKMTRSQFQRYVKKFGRSNLSLSVTCKNGKAIEVSIAP